jgi:hypothetical protein
MHQVEEFHQPFSPDLFSMSDSDHSPKSPALPVLLAMRKWIVLKQDERE